MVHEHHTVTEAMQELAYVYGLRSLTHGRVTWLGHMVGYHGRVTWSGHMVGSHGRVPWSKFYYTPAKLSGQ